MSITTNEFKNYCKNCRFETDYSSEAISACTNCVHDTGDADNWQPIPALADVPNLALARVRAEVVRMRDNVEIPARDDDRPSAWGLRTYRAAFCTVLDLIDRDAQK